MQLVNHTLPNLAAQFKTHTQTRKKSDHQAPPQLHRSQTYLMGFQAVLRLPWHTLLHILPRTLWVQDTQCHQLDTFQTECLLCMDILSHIVGAIHHHRTVFTDGMITVWEHHTDGKRTPRTTSVNPLNCLLTKIPCLPTRRSQGLSWLQG